MRRMNEFYELVLAFSFCLSVVVALPTTEKSEKDDGLQRIVDVLEKHFNQQKLTSNEQQKTNEVEKKGKLCPDNEEDAERQTVHIDGHNEKPNDLCVNKEQEQDDEKDRPPPVVFGIRKVSGREKRNFGISTSRLWTNGVIPYVIDADSFEILKSDNGRLLKKQIMPVVKNLVKRDNNVTESDVHFTAEKLMKAELHVRGSRLSKATTLVQETAHNISQTTCVKWRLKTPEDNYFIKFIGNHIGCWSYLGNMSMEGGQPISLSNGCLDAYVILHEMHHAMGGIHEQQRDRRKNFVKINWENIETQFTDQFVLNLHTKNREIYDYRSILQYHLKSFSSSFKKTMTIPDEDLEYLISNPKYSFSFYDIAEVNKAYRCATASCSLTCKNDGFRMRAVDQKTCHCQCPSGFKGTTCEELDTDDDCGETITILNGESRDINLLSYRSGKTCTWLVKAESDSVIRAIVTSIDLPYSARKECYHWLEIRDYLIGDPGKELCGKSATPKTYTQFNIGEGSPLMIRFHSMRDHTPGTGFSITVEAFQSGCMSFPCKTGSTCTEGGGDGSYTCTCKNGLTGTNCDEFKALSQNFCNFEDDFGTCIFDQDTTGASDILWSFNSKLCKTAKGQCLTHGTDYQFLTMTPFYDDVPFDIGSKAIIKTTVKFTANDRCLSFDYAVGTFPSGLPSTQLNVLVEGTGHTKTKLYNVKTTTNYKWQTARVSIESMEDLVISIEGIMGYSFIGVDNIYLRPGSCTICNLNPCKNGGTCEASNSPTGSEYTCSCPEGFSGKMCEIDVCDCQNGGSCVADHVSIGGYTCSCLTGYVGDRCEGNTCRFEVENDPACFLDTDDPKSSWFRRKGPTPTGGTGPSNAYEGSYYFYFEATDHSKGVVMNDKVVFDNKTYCLSLAYHMYGSGMGTISIYTYNTNLGLLKKQFSVNGTQGKEWHKVDIDLPLDRKTRLIIMSVRGKSYQSDIAIDDVTLMPRPCSA